MTTKAQRPNFLVIMADQHRHDWLGSRGSSWVRTPHLDKLANSGVTFTNATTNAPLCAPARGSIASGMRPSRIGMLDNNCFYPVGTPTYYQVLRDVGYRVGLVGKLDLHKPDPYNGPRGDLPLLYRYGFTDPLECEGKEHAGTGWPTPLGPYNHYLAEQGLLEPFCADYRLRRQEPVWYAADSVLPTEAWEDCFVSRKAVELLRSYAAESPWHLFVSFVGPHDPWDPPREYAEHFRTTTMPSPIRAPLEGKPAWVRERAERRYGWPEDEDALTTVQRQYSASVELIDAQVGRIMEVLDEVGMLDTTYVFYCSDHGEMLGDHGLWQKSVFYEAALRVPLIVSGPGVGSAVSQAVVETADLHPTILELAGAYPRGETQAKSFSRLLDQPEGSHRTHAFSELFNARCLRDTQYKYIENFNDRDELYNLADDPSERHNLIDDEPSTVTAYRKLLRGSAHGH